MGTYCAYYRDRCRNISKIEIIKKVISNLKSLFLMLKFNGFPGDELLGTVMKAVDNGEVKVESEGDFSFRKIELKEVKVKYYFLIKHQCYLQHNQV